MKIRSVKPKRRRTAVRTTKKRSDQWDLQLFVVGNTRKSANALANLKLICERQLNGKYRIEVVDLRKHPQLARDYQIIAVPTLVRKLPLPLRSVIGDLSDTERVLVGLDLHQRSASA